MHEVATERRLCLTFAFGAAHQRYFRPILDAFRALIGSEKPLHESTLTSAAQGPPHIQPAIVKGKSNATCEKAGIA